MFDKQPPVEGSDSFTFRIGSVPSNLYDFEGRTFFANVSVKL